MSFAKKLFSCVARTEREFEFEEIKTHIKQKIDLRKLG
jgi:hypothetical protein